MKIVHLSDSHLGFSSYSKLTKDSYNQREEDVRKAFTSTVEKILEIKPDVVLHTGDLFDSPRPSNRSLTLAIEQLLRLKDSGIPMVIISGNHDTPKIRSTGSVFSLFEAMQGLDNPQTFFHLSSPMIFPVHQSNYQVIKIKDLTIHAIPQSSSNETLQEELGKVKPEISTKYNCLMLHVAVSGIKEFSRGDFNEQFVGMEKLEGFSSFDYIALGHLHRQTKVLENAFYAGATESFSFNDVGQAKGFLVVDLAKREFTSHQLETRPMVEITSINAQDKDTNELMATIEEVINNYQITGKIVRMKINHISSQVMNSLNHRLLNQLISPALHFEFVFDPTDEVTKLLDKPNIGHLSDEFVEFINCSTLPIEEKEGLKNLGLDYLNRAQ